VAKASGRITWGQLAKNWLNVYVGNLIGADTQADGFNKRMVHFVVCSLQNI
jgi:formate/nitrite transporter FocA (FNT family)